MLNCRLSDERNLRELVLELCISLELFDKNANVRFHRWVFATGLQKSPAHDLVHSQLFDHIRLHPSRL